MKFQKSTSQFFQLLLQIGFAALNCSGYLLPNGKCIPKCIVPINVNMKCGSNGVTYQNIQELICARENCFPDLELAYDGECQAELAEPPKVPHQLLKEQVPRLVPAAPGLNSIFTATTRVPKFVSSTKSYPGILFDDYEPQRKKQRPSSSILPISNSRPKLKPKTPKHNPKRVVSSPKSDSNNELCSPDDCVCDFILAPVCGTKGVTYGNQCIMDCLQDCDASVTYHHDGFCGKIFFPLDEIPFFRIFIASTLKERRLP